MNVEYVNKVIRLCDDYVKSNDPKMKWMWGEGLLGYALLKLDEKLGTSRYTEFIKKYCDYYVLNQPLIDQADRVAPVLITYTMQKLTGNEDYKKLTERGINYIVNSPRLVDDCVNHLGNSLVGKFYPKSIWVDSLMMFGVLPAIYGKGEGRQDILDMAASQPLTHAKYLNNRKSGLWYHSYWTRLKQAYPQRSLYWARGNGWVLCALPMILDQLSDNDKNKQEIIWMYQKTSAAVRTYQKHSGMFTTLLTKKSYEETSATALIAAGFLHGAQQGYLDASYLESGLKSYRSVVDHLYINDLGNMAMPLISGPTIPMPIFPKLGYTLVPRKDNWSYGIAALIFATIQYINA